MQVILEYRELAQKRKTEFKFCNAVGKLVVGKDVNFGMYPYMYRFQRVILNYVVYILNSRKYASEVPPACQAKLQWWFGWSRQR